MLSKGFSVTQAFSSAHYVPGVNNLFTLGIYPRCSWQIDSATLSLAVSEGNAAKQNDGSFNISDNGLGAIVASQSWQCNTLLNTWVEISSGLVIPGPIVIQEGASATFSITFAFDQINFIYGTLQIEGNLV